MLQHLPDELLILSGIIRVGKILKRRGRINPVTLILAGVTDAAKDLTYKRLTGYPHMRCGLSAKP